MSTLYLHSGPFKTGSTFLQNAIPSFIVVPKSDSVRLGFGPRLGWPEGTFNVSWLAGVLEPENPFLFELTKHSWPTQDPFQVLNQELEQGDVFLSGEHMGNLSPTGYERLKDYIGPHEVKVMLFARPYESRFLSQWQESIKWGETISFRDAVEAQFSNARQRDNFDLSRKYKSAVEGIGDESCVSISTLACNRFSLEELCMMLSKWTSQTINIDYDPGVAGNRGLNFKFTSLVVTLNHVIESGCRTEAIANTFAKQLESNLEKVEEYLASHVTEALETLKKLKNLELRSLSEMRPNCPEGTDSLLEEISQNRSPAVRRFFKT